MQAQGKAKFHSRWVALLLIFGVIAAACGSTTSTASDDGGSGDAAADWDAVVAQAQGQTVQLWMWGGDTVLNAYIQDTVAPIVAEQGVRSFCTISATVSLLSHILISRAHATPRDGVLGLLYAHLPAH